MKKRVLIPTLLVLLFIALTGCSTMSMTVMPLHKPEPDVAVNKEALAKIRTIAVLPFQDSDKSDALYLPSPPWPPVTPKRRYPYKNDGEVVANLLATEFVKSFKFRMLDRHHLDKILQEQRLQGSGLFDAERAVDIGKLVAADAVIFGRVNICCFDKQYRYQGGNRIDQELAFVSIDYRMVSVGKAEIIAFAHHELNSQNLLANPITMTHQEIMENPNKYTDAIPSLDLVVKQLIHESIMPVLAAAKN